MHTHYPWEQRLTVYAALARGESAVEVGRMKRPGFDGDSAHLISTSSLALVTPA
ncbi:hypothetical protein ACI1US_02324 [Leucobacter sp. BZR 635]